MNRRYIVDEGILVNLIAAKRVVNAFEANGVDEWEGYDRSILGVLEGQRKDERYKDIKSILDIAKIDVGVFELLDEDDGK